MPIVLRAALGAASLALAQTITTVAHAESPSKRECVAASETGQGLRNTGHLHDARTKFRECVSPSCPRAVREDCAQRLAEIEPAMPTLVLAAKDLAGNDLFAVNVRIDGQPLTDRLGGSAIEVDPGEHNFTFEVAGQPPVDRTVMVRQGEKDRLVLVVVGPALPPPKPVPNPAPPSPPPPPPPVAVSDGSTQQLIGITLGGVGVATAAVAVVLSLLAKSTYDHALSAECGGVVNACTAQGAADSNTAFAEAAGATGAFIAAGALVAGGAVVFFTAPRGAHIAPVVGSRRAGVALELPW